jgi:hypothetical protein
MTDIKIRWLFAILALTTRQVDYYKHSRILIKIGSDVFDACGLIKTSDLGWT